MSVRMYPRSFHWTDFCGSWYWRLSWKSVDKIKVWLKSDKSIVPFACIGKCVHIVDRSMEYCAARQHCQGNPLLRFIGNTQQFTLLQATYCSATVAGNVLLLFHCNCGCAKTPQCYVMRTLNALFTCSWATKNKFLDRGPEVVSVCGMLILRVYSSGCSEMHQ